MTSLTTHKRHIKYRLWDVPHIPHRLNMTHKRHIYLSEDIDRKLVELAAHEGLSVSALIRRLIVLLHAKQIGAKNEARD